MRHKDTELKLALFSLLAVMCLILGSSTLAMPSKAASFPLTIIDGLNREVTVPRPPQRLVALTPSITENLFALGLGDKVVGVSSYSDYPLAAQNIPVVGDAFQLNYEQILLLEPDLIVGDAQLVSNHMAKLEELDLPLLPSTLRISRKSWRICLS